MSKNNNWQRHQNVDIYSPSQSPERLVMFNPGFLCEDSIDRSVFEQAIGTMPVALGVVRQRPTARPSTFHRATKETVEILGIEEVEVVDNSLGHLDVLESIHYQAKRQGRYRIARLTGTDAIGSNGKRVNASVVLEAINVGFDSRSHGVVGRSTVNAFRAPLKQSYEAVRAYVTSDTSKLEEACYEASVRLDFVFHEHDRIIRMPSDKRVTMLQQRGSNVTVLPGGHLSTVSEPSTLHGVLRAA